MTTAAADGPERRDSNRDETSVAAWIARALKARGVDRVFGLQGGHIQPIWDRVAQAGIRIVDVRDERAAMHMAHAHAELTGSLGVAMATAGPGVTNTVTAVANAALARVPVLLIGGCAPRVQDNMGPLQGVPQTDIMRPITRYARTARIAEHALRELDEAIACAAGDTGEPGPAYIEIPTDVLRRPVARNLVLDEWLEPAPPRRLPPDPARVAGPRPRSGPPAGRWRFPAAAPGARGTRCCASSMPPMRSISIPRRAAASPRRTIPPPSDRCAGRRWPGRTW